MKKGKKVNKNCGTRLKDARRRKGYTQEKLSELVDVDTKYISALENNHRSMSIELAERLSKVLAVRTEFLLGIDDYESNIDLFSSKLYSHHDAFAYFEIMERNNYTLSTPFGPDGDTALLTFLQFYDEDVVITHEGDHFSCSPEQLKCFLKSTAEALEKIKVSFIQQFLSCTCVQIDQRQYEELMIAMNNKLHKNSPAASKTWQAQQKLLDSGDFESIDDDAWLQSVRNISSTSFGQLLNMLGPEDSKLLIQILKRNE